MRRFQAVILLVAPLLSMGWAHDVQAQVIASESFQTTEAGAGGTYDDGAGFDTTANRAVVVGNFGFNTTNEWDSNTSTIIADNDVPVAGSGLTHSLVAGDLPGAAQYNRHFTRNAERGLAAAPPVSDSYFISGIVRAEVVATDGDFFSMGLFDGGIGNNTTDISTGFHLGMFRDDAIANNELRLGAFGAGSQFDLGPATLDTNYLIVLELVANAGGADELNAWIAEDGAGALTQVLSNESLETFSGVGDIDTLLLQQTDASAGGAVPGWIDELRFGTSLFDVAPLAVPEPASIAIWSLLACCLGIAGFSHRRRRAA